MTDRKAIPGHKVTRHTRQDGYSKRWYYTCECGYVTHGRFSIEGARAQIYADHLQYVNEREFKYDTN